MISWLKYNILPISFQSSLSLYKLELQWTKLNLQFWMVIQLKPCLNIINCYNPRTVYSDKYNNVQYFIYPTCYIHHHLINILKKDVKCQPTKTNFTNNLWSCGVFVIVFKGYVLNSNN
jgi:hypothetical protein